MKIKREAKGFQPIHITLETSEEAKCLYQILNCPEAGSLADYCKNDLTRNDAIETIFEFKMKLHELLGDIANLDGCRDVK